MVRYRVVVDKEACIACGVCYSVCPEVFEGDETGKSTLKSDYRVYDDAHKSEGLVGEELRGCVEEAKNSCPVEAISLERSE